ncbi:MAG: transposase [Flavobacteriales bacterium Tduv]
MIHWEVNGERNKKNESVVERTFGRIKRWFGSGKARYKGLARVHAQLLWRLWRIICTVPLELLCTVYKNNYN